MRRSTRTSSSCGSPAGDTITFKTYKQGADTLGGATLHFVGYDEPPPREHRDEAMTRLLVHDGYEMFAMTPLKVNTGWIRRDIYKQREHPDVTVVRGSMHDNPTIDPKAGTGSLASTRTTCGVGRVSSGISLRWAA
jgi:phage terminase large subunit-like protein